MLEYIRRCNFEPYKCNVSVFYFATRNALDVFDNVWLFAIVKWNIVTTDVSWAETRAEMPTIYTAYLPKYNLHLHDNKSIFVYIFFSNIVTILYNINDNLPGISSACRFVVRLRPSVLCNSCRQISSPRHRRVGVSRCPSTRFCCELLFPIFGPRSTMDTRQTCERVQNTVVN